VRAHRVGMPKDLAVEKLKTGEISFRRKGDLCALKWSDKWDVIILPSAHDPIKTKLVSQVGIFKGPKRNQFVSQTTQKNMCGVDHSDQLMSYLPLSRRSKLCDSDSCSGQQQQLIYVKSRNHVSVVFSKVLLILRHFPLLFIINDMGFRTFPRCENYAHF